MNTFTRGIDRAACAVVDAVRLTSRHRLVGACIGLALIVVIAGGYILVSSLRLNPTRSMMAVRVMLPESGGLLPNQDVTLRGIPVGRVTSVQPSGNGVLAVAEIDSDVRIPQNSPVRVAGLSAAGEQYLEFRPEDYGGPLLKNGSTISENQTDIPVSLARLLVDADGTLAQLEPEKLTAITDELRVSRQGPEKLAAILDGGAVLLTSLYSVLPQTVSVIRDSRTVLTTLSDGSAGLQQTGDNLKQILTGVNALDTGFRTLLDTGTRPLSAVDKLIAQNSDTMVQLLGNLTTVAQLSYIRLPALNALFPTNRGSIFDALASTFHDGGAWALTSLYPHTSCDYKLPRHSPYVPDFHEVYLYTYCDDPDPAQLIRGARNAPRPPGDDTNGPPPGYDPLKTTDPTPIGPLSIPTNYGGPPLPQIPPP